jgi:ATP-binding cassette, subfamily B, bacterial
VVEVGANFARRFASNVASMRMEFALCNDFYTHLQSLQVSFHDGWQSGQLLSRAVADVQSVRRFIGFGLVFAGYFVALWLCVLAILVWLDWRLALLMLLLGLPIYGASRRFFRHYRVIARRVQDQTGDLTTVIEEMATGVRIIKAFGRHAILLDRFRTEAHQLRDINLDGVRRRAETSALFTLLPQLNLALVLPVGGWQVSHGDLSLGGLVAFMTYLFMLVWPLDALAWILAMGEEAATASQRLAEVFDARPEIQDRPPARALSRPRGVVRLEEVGFRYSGPGGWVLRRLDLELRAGETVAVVGATGSGKTTLLSLVPRL